MPWYWTDDLAHRLIDTGKVEQRQVATWLSAPVAIRSSELDSQLVAEALLAGEGEEGEPPSLPAAA